MMMANEVIKIIAGIGEVLSGKFLLVDLLAVKFQEIKIERNEQAIRSAPQNAEEFRKTDYDLFCGIQESTPVLKQISAEELSGMLSAKESLQLLDVREINELPLVPELNDLKIPLGTIENNIDLIARDKKVVVICRSGARSARAIELLSGKFGFQNLHNLQGGVTAWMRLIKERS